MSRLVLKLAVLAAITSASLAIVLGAGTSTQAANQVTNGSFDSDASGWTGDAGTTLTWSSTEGQPAGAGELSMPGMLHVSYARQCVALGAFGMSEVTLSGDLNLSAGFGTDVALQAELYVSNDCTGTALETVTSTFAFGAGWSSGTGTSSTGTFGSAFVLIQIHSHDFGTVTAFFDNVSIDGTSLATATPTETATSTATSTDTPTETPTDTPTSTQTPTPTETSTPTSTATPTDTPTSTQTLTETSTSTSTATPTETAVPTDTPTSTSTVEATDTPDSDDDDDDGPDATHTPLPGSKFIGPDGGTVELPSGESVTFPPGSLDEDTWITLSAPDDCDVTPPPATFVVFIRCITALPSGVTFDPPASLTFPYTDADVSGFDETTLSIWVLINGQWSLLGGSIDANAHTVTVSVPHFTTYALFVALDPVAQPSLGNPPASEIIAPNTGTGGARPSGNPLMHAFVALGAAAGLLAAGTGLAGRRSRST